VLFILPWLDRSPVRSATFRPVYKWFFWVLGVDCILLGWCGANAPDDVWMGMQFVVWSRIATVYYFVHFLVIIPYLGLFERPKQPPASIAEAVLGGGSGAAAAVTAKPMEKA
jgi:quinol-cytochrome oxidoreductase complex cytochrome b subunit